MGDGEILCVGNVLDTHTHPGNQILQRSNWYVMISNITCQFRAYKNMPLHILLVFYFILSNAKSLGMKSVRDLLLLAEDIPLSVLLLIFNRLMIQFVCTIGVQCVILQYDTVVIQLSDNVSRNFKIYEISNEKFTKSR